MSVSSVSAPTSGCSEMSSNALAISSRKSSGANGRFFRHHRDSLRICSAARGVGLTRNGIESVGLFERSNQFVGLYELSALRLSDRLQEFSLLLGRDMKCLRSFSRQDRNFLTLCELGIFDNNSAALDRPAQDPHGCILPLQAISPFAVQLPSQAPRAGPPPALGTSMPSAVN